MRLLLLLFLLIALAAWPLAWVLDRTTGVTAWEMQELYPADERVDPAMMGFSESDPISDRLEAIGIPGAATRSSDEPMRWVLVDQERVHETDLGTVVVFDRTVGEEVMQAQSLYNIALLTAGAAALATILLALVSWLRTWRRQDPAAS